MSNFIISENSLMAFQAALRLHARIRNSFTRNLFFKLETSIKSSIKAQNHFYREILAKFNIIEFSN